MLRFTPKRVISVFVTLTLRLTHTHTHTWVFVPNNDLLSQKKKHVHMPSLHQQSPRVIKRGGNEIWLFL